MNLARRVTGSTSFAEAIHKNQSTHRWQHAREMSKRVGGRTVEDGCWEDDRLAILLSGEYGLYFMTESEVQWQLITRTEFDAFRLKWRSDNEPIRANLDCLDGRVLVTGMDRKRIIGDLIGSQIKSIGVDSFGTYLHFEGIRRHLALHALVLADQQLPFLYWFEGDD
jgi:hypothetical protein